MNRSIHLSQKQTLIAFHTETLKLFGVIAQLGKTGCHDQIKGPLKGTIMNGKTSRHGHGFIPNHIHLHGGRHGLCVELDLNRIVNH